MAERLPGTSRRTTHLRRRRGRERARATQPNLIVRIVLSTVPPILLATLLTPLIAIGAVLYVYQHFAAQLVPPETMVQREVSQSTKIYDRNGELLNEIFDPRGGRRTSVPLREIPPRLRQATIATEDADFYRNQGVNWRGLARAMLTNLRAREAVEGGSSITQQLVKNVLIPEEERSVRSVTRKIKEFILAIEVTRRYSKDQILEWYLNEINYGNLSYGIEAAAESYFGKPAMELTLAESAMLAGLPQMPGRYDPFTNPKPAKQRQLEVLNLMVRHGYITQAAATEAYREELHFATQKYPIRAPHFVMYVRELIAERYGLDALQRGGLQVVTTLDIHLQEEAERIARTHVARLKAQNAHNAALVAIRPATGEILTMVGSVDYFDSTIDGQVNVTLAERQPGSTIKPFSYVTAFAKGWTPATVVLDVPTTFRDSLNRPYEPKNVDGKFRGPVSVREALATSLNIPAVRTIQFAGVPNVVEMAHRLGITSLNRENTYGLALTLGGGEVKLLDLVYAYSVFANEGRMAGAIVPFERLRPGHRELEPVSILKVTDASGQTLEEYRTARQKQAIPPPLAYLITNILSDNDARAVFFGANNPLRLKSRPAAAKTGTTDDSRDVWTVGYTPDLAAGVWVGNSNNARMANTFGSTAAAPLWQEFMELAHQNLPPRSFREPEGIERVRVCAPSGLLPTPQCPRARNEVFIKGTAPRTPDTMFQLVKIDTRTGQLATPETPPDEVEEKVFQMLPAEAAEWGKANEIAQPPTETSPRAQPAVAGLGLRAPTAGAAVHGAVELRGTTSIPDFAYYWVEFGEGRAPTEWTQIGSPSQSEVRDGPLATWNTAEMNGLYSLRLTAFDRRGDSHQLVVPVVVDNVAPDVRLSFPSAGAVLPGASSPVKLQAEATDNFGVSAVEFLVDGQSAGSVSSPPYTLEWPPQPGEHEVIAVVRDQAGNEARSVPAKFTVR